MAEGTTIQLRFDPTSHETVKVVPLGERRYRLNETPLAANELAYAGDVIEATPAPDGTFQFVRVLEPAPMRHYAWLVPRGWADSADRTAYVAKVEAAGGTWEQALGGLLQVHIPIGSGFDAEAELDRYLKSHWPEA